MADHILVQEWEWDVYSVYSVKNKKKIKNGLRKKKKKKKKMVYEKKKHGKKWFTKKKKYIYIYIHIWKKGAVTLG